MANTIVRILGERAVARSCIEAHEPIRAMASEGYSRSPNGG
jgi:hypothetical protein